MFSVDVTGHKWIWMVGDNFTATSYRKYYLTRSDNDEAFMKVNYEFSMSCNSKYNSANKNPLVRIQNSFAMAINKKENSPMADYILVILDDDLIQFLDYDGLGAGEIYGSWIQWLATECEQLLKDRKNQLKKMGKEKAIKNTCVYWSVAPMHCSFSWNENEQRKKFNFSLGSTIKNMDNMRVIKLKSWDFENIGSTLNGSFTEGGLSRYWDALDDAFRFNANRHEIFIAKNIINTAKEKEKEQESKETLQEDEQKKRRPAPNRVWDQVPRFFENHRDRFHWKKNSNSFDNKRNNRFLLRRPRY